MNGKKIVSIVLLVLLVVGLNSCRKSGLSREEITVNNFPAAIIDSDKKVMVSTLFDRLAESEFLIDGGLIDSTIYFDTLNELIIDSIVSLEADTVDISLDRSSYYTFNLRFRDYYMNYVYQRLVLDPIKVDSASVDSFYHAYPEYFAMDAQVRARHLVISVTGLKLSADSVLYRDYAPERLDSVAHEKVIEIKRKIDDGAEFGHMANEYSMHRQSGRADGELGYFRRGKYNKEFEEVAFSLPKGAISDPFKTPDGWHLVQIMDHVDSGLTPLTGEVYDKAASAVAGIRARAIAGALMDSLNAEAEIIYNDSALAGNPYDPPESTWAAIVNGIDTVTFFRLPDLMHAWKSNRNLEVLTLDDIKDALYQRAQRYVLMQAGDRLGYNRDPKVEEHRYNLYHSYAKNIVRREGQDIDWRPDDSMVADYYQRHIDRYTFDKPVYVQHIILEDSLFGEYLREQALSGLDFLEMAEEYYPGEKEIRRSASDLGYIGPGEMPDNFYQAALRTMTKSVSHPVKTKWGYHIIKVLDKKHDISIDAATMGIVNILRNEHQRMWLRQWKKDILARHKIDYFLDRIGTIELPSKKNR
jgi:parvulin-like peptidyl-prolyl isomerase